MNPSIRRLWYLPLMLALTGCGGDRDPAPVVVAEKIAADPNAVWVDALRSENLSRRRLAAELLAVSPNETLPIAFLDLLNDPDPDIRQAVVRAILRHAGTVKPAEVMPALRQQLPRTTSLARLDVIEAMLRLDPRQGPGVEPLLKETLLDRDPVVQMGALRLIRQLDTAAVPLLIHGLTFGDDRLRVAIIPELARRGRIAGGAQPIIQTLIPQVGADTRLRLLALNMIISGSPNALALIQAAIAESDAYGRMIIVETLAIGDNRASVKPILRNLLRDTEPIVVVRSLAGLREDREMIPRSEILPLLRSPAPMVKLAAGQLLAELRIPPRDEILTAIVPLMQHPSEEQADAVALGVKLEPARTSEFLEWLSRSFAHGRADWRLSAMRRWMELAPDRAIEIQKVLASELSDRRENRMAVLAWLGQCPQAASLVTGELVELLDERPSAIRIRTLAALTGTIPESGWNRLLVQVSDRDPMIRTTALATIIRLDASTGRTRLAALSNEVEPWYRGKSLDNWRECLRDRDPERRFLAVQSLIDLDAMQTKSMLTAIIERLNDDQPDIRIATVQTLASLAVHAPEIPTRLRASLNQKDGRVRIAIIETLFRRDSRESDTLMPLLTQSLTDRDADVRRWASRAMEQMRPKPIPLSPTIPAPPGSPPGLIVPR